MSVVQHISVEDAEQLIFRREDTLLLDMRDERAFHAGHHPAAVHLNDGNIRRILRQTDKSRHILVCCYHGASSRDMAQLFTDAGFTNCFSVDGGYQAWGAGKAVATAAPY